MATLLKETGRASLPIGEGEISFRRATSMDQDVAQETAAGWFSQIIDGQPVAQDFGLGGDDLSGVIARVLNGERDLRAVSTALFAVALALRLDPKVTDLLREDPGASDPRPLRADRTDLAWLFGEKRFQDEFLSLALSNLYALEALGKPSGAASGMSAEPAP